MASVTIWYHFADGDHIGATVEGDLTYPDALDQLKAEALNVFRQALADGVATVADEGDE